MISKAEIEDECGGIPESKAELFQAFGERRGADRSGLGLFIARQAVRAHGGDITIRNMPGRGGIFAIDVPLAARVVSVSQFGLEGSRHPSVTSWYASPTRSIEANSVARHPPRTASTETERRRGPQMTRVVQAEGPSSNVSWQQRRCGVGGFEVVPTTDVEITVQPRVLSGATEPLSADQRRCDLLQAIRHSLNVATASPPSIAGMMTSSSRETASRFVAYSSSSMVVPGGENVNCCRTISR